MRIHALTSKRNERCFVTRLFMLICCLCVSCYCLAEINDTDKQKVRHILIGLDDARMRLNSGVCRIETSEGRGIPGIVEDDILMAFDYNAKYIRFDLGTDRSLYTPEYYYEYLDGDHVVSRASRHESESLLDIRPFDIRMLGLLSLTRNRSIDYTSFEQIQTFKDKPLALKETNGVYELTVERIVEPPPGFESVPVIRKYWIDSNRGFAMVRLEFYDGSDTSRAVLGTNEISWKEINKTWVPTSLILTDKQDDYILEWTLDWSLVNEPVPESYFDPTLLSEKDAVFVSLELGDPIVLGKIGPGREVSGPLVTPEKRDYSLLRYTLMGLGICLIVLALSKKAYDWWKQ